jgi:hypothetical protein
MTGLSGEATSYLGSLAASVIEGAEIDELNPARFDSEKVVVGFNLKLQKPEPDDHDRIRLSIGEPSSGIAGVLADDIELFHQQRSSLVRFPTSMSQSVRIRIGLRGLEAVYRPENKTISNGAGGFTVSVIEEDDEIIIERRLSLTKDTYDAEEWPDLRSILLADRHERNQTIILRPTDGTKDNENQ